MNWIDDLDMAPRNSEWVLGMIKMDDGEDSLISEVIIFDSGMWTDTHGNVVEPVAWAKIKPYKPADHSKYDWEGEFQELFESLYEHMPIGFCLMGLAVAHYENGEGALITDPEMPDLESTIWDADVWQDILGDAKRCYERSAENYQRLTNPRGTTH